MPARQSRTSALVSSPFLDPVQLIDHSRFVADEVNDGRYPWIDFDPDERWHQRLYRDPRVDVWLISWLPEQGTQLHDHGASAGAFTVVSGTLTESVVRGGVLEDREWSASQSVGFGSSYVHDVRNTSTAPAVSVHVYSPPLVTMNFYDLGSGGSLDLLASVATDDPEAAPPAAVRQAKERAA